MRGLDYRPLVHAQEKFSSTGSPGDPSYYKHLRERFPFVIFPFRQISFNLDLTKTVELLLSWSIQSSDGLFGSRKKDNNRFFVFCCHVRLVRRSLYIRF